jgi:hypothetical protein
MIDSIAKIISIIFNPFFILLPTPYLLVDRISNNDLLALKWALFTYVFMLVIGIFIVAGVSLGVFSDIDVSKREERPILFTFIGIVAFFYLLSLFVLNGPKILFIAVSATILGLIFFSIVNRKIKASIHVATISSVISSIAIIYGGIFLFAFSIIPIIAWSRVKTKKHTPIEAFTGGILGIILTIIVYTVGKQFI